MVAKKFMLFCVLLSVGFAVSAQRHGRHVPDKDRELFRNLGYIMRLPEGTHKIYNGKGSSVFDVVYMIEVSEDKRVVYKGGTKSVFDILYTMEYADNTFTVYRGRSTFRSDIIYSFETTREGFREYRREASGGDFSRSDRGGRSVMPSFDRELFGNLIGIMRLPKGTHKIYNGTGSTMFDVLYTIEVTDDKRTVYKGGMKSVFDILYSIERSGNIYRIYKGGTSRFDVIYTIEKDRDGFKVYKGDSRFWGLLYSYEK